MKNINCLSAYNESYAYVWVRLMLRNEYIREVAPDQTNHSEKSLHTSKHIIANNNLFSKQTSPLHTGDNDVVEHDHVTIRLTIPYRPYN